MFLADLENLPKWNYFVTRVTKTFEGSPDVGSICHQVRKTDSQDLRIVEFEKDQVLTVETIPPSKHELRRKMTLQETGGATTVIDRWELDTGHPGILQALGKGKVKSAVRENLVKLKELLETGSVTLQDGRQVSL